VRRTKIRSVGLSRSRLRAFYVTGVGVWLTGGLWLLFHYFVTKQGEFGPQSNPLEPWWLKLHGAFALAATWFFGLLWGTHMTVAWPSARRRRSGGVLGGVVLWLIITGYLLYYVGNDTARAIVSMGHWVIGIACPLLYWVHRKRKKRSLQLSRPAQNQSGMVL
jgi:hypothetical protein